MRSIAGLSEVFTKLVTQGGDKRTVLLIDEVDKSSNNQLFLDFLGLLRSKYMERRTEKTFHAVILAGVHDVRSLKLKLRPGQDADYNSPWNIAADFNVDMSLFPNEIKPMLDEYSVDNGVSMATETIAEKIFYFSSGYPFLVSALCKIIHEELLPQKELPSWTEKDVEDAAQRLIQLERSNTNFDSLIKNLENNEDLYALVYRMIIENEAIYFNIHDPIISKGMMYGIFRNGQGLHIHNRIYRELAANYMISKLLTSDKGPQTEAATPYLLPGNALNVARVLTKFQDYMLEQYSSKGRDFLERHGRLVFLAFLKPIINGKGYTFKEPEVSEERRLDIAITFMQHRYIVELKIWRGEATHEHGLAQLADYLDRNNLSEGYLVIFDQRAKQKSWLRRQYDIGGKRIFAVWV